MPASKRYMNWTNVSFTPVSGVAMHITGVTSVQIDTGGSLIKFAGDGDRYSTAVVNDFNDPMITVHTADLLSVSSLPTGTVGVFTATHNDARNGPGTGAVTYTLSNAVVASNPIQGGHRKFGQGVITFTAYSQDGITNPMSISVA